MMGYVNSTTVRHVQASEKNCLCLPLFVYNLLGCRNHHSMDFDKKMSNQPFPTGFFYSNTMESYLSIIMRNEGTRSIMGGKVNGKMSKMCNRSLQAKEDMENGWKTRQSRQKNATGNRTV